MVSLSALPPALIHKHFAKGCCCRLSWRWWRGLCGTASSCASARCRRSGTCSPALGLVRGHGGLLALPMRAGLSIWSMIRAGCGGYPSPTRVQGVPDGQLGWEFAQVARAAAAEACSLLVPRATPAAPCRPHGPADARDARPGAQAQLCAAAGREAAVHRAQHPRYTLLQGHVYEPHGWVGGWVGASGQGAWVVMAVSQTAEGRLHLGVLRG